MPYSYSEIESKIFYRCFDGDDVGVSPQANPSRPPKGEKSSYTRTDLHLTLPSGGQTRSSLAGGSQPIALPCRSKAAATDQEAGPYRPRAPPQERQHPMLSRRLLLGLPSQLPKNRRILTQNTSKADSSTNLCPPERGKGPVLARVGGAWGPGVSNGRKYKASGRTPPPCCAWSPATA